MSATIKTFLYKSLLAKRLCAELVDLATIEPILANRLIPLNKGYGEVRPIGVGEVSRTINAKCVTRKTKRILLRPSAFYKCAQV